MAPSRVRPSISIGWPATPQRHEGSAGSGSGSIGAWRGTSTATRTSATDWKQLTSMCPTPCIRGPRGRGVAVEAVRLICALIGTNQIGRRAAIRVEPENKASVRVARKCGFSYVRDFVSTTDTHHDGTSVTFSLYLLQLRRHRSHTHAGGR